MAEQNSWLKKFQTLLDERGWRSETELTKAHRFVHFWILLGKSFVRNRCPVRASALSYTTLLALIPMCAVAISITNSLLKKEGEEQIYHYIDKFVSSVIPPTIEKTNHPPAETSISSTESSSNNAASASAQIEPSPTNALAGSVIEDRATAAQRTAAKKIHEFIQNTQTTTVGVTGVILLVFVGIRLLGSIESTFNDIWGVIRGRNLWTQVQIYCTTIVLGPALLVSAAGLSGGPHLQATRRFITEFPIVGPIVFPALTLLVIWLMFAMFYQLVPNTKVRFTAALVGGVVAGTAWHITNVFGFLFASRVVTYSKVYGGLALVPVFMVGIYTSWFIMLFGAQLAYAFQNRTLYLQEKIAENVNQRGREFVALRLMTCIGQRFHRGLPPPTVQEMSGELGVPSRLVQQVLRTLIAAHLVIEVSGAEPAYTPARPLDSINAHHVLQAMRVTIGQELITRDEPVREEIYGEFARIQEAEKRAASSVTMLALVDRAQAHQLPPPVEDAGDLKLKPAITPKVEPAPEPPTPPPATEVQPKEIPKLAAETPVEEPHIEAQVTPASSPAPDREEERDFPL